MKTLTFLFFSSARNERSIESIALTNLKKTPQQTSRLFARAKSLDDWLTTFTKDRKDVISAKLDCEKAIKSLTHDPQPGYQKCILDNQKTAAKLATTLEEIEKRIALIKRNVVPTKPQVEQQPTLAGC
jgi:hypothetical protein